MFSGLGADQLMAGYRARHRTVHKAEGLAGIQAEMDAGSATLWLTNIGRGDRLIADHAVEVRHPLLDEESRSIRRLFATAACCTCTCVTFPYQTE